MNDVRERPGMAEKDNDQTEKKTLSLGGKKLELKRTVEAGQIRQSFSHGRTKTVAFEVKKKRNLERSSDEKDKQERTLTTLQKGTGLTEGEIEARMRILREAERTGDEEKKRQEELARLMELDAERKQELERQKEHERLVKEKQDADKLESEKAAQEAAEKKAAGSGKPSAESEISPATVAPAEPSDREDAGHRLTLKPRETTLTEEEERQERNRKAAAETRRSTTPPKRDVKQRLHRLSYQDALEGKDDQTRHPSMAAIRRHREKRREQSRDSQETKFIVREVQLPEVITVQELANRMAVRAAEVIKKLMAMGVIATINQNLDADTAELIISEFGHTVKRITDADIETQWFQQEADSEASLLPRPPVVTVMGHVDHGKTSLLDAIRKTDVVSTEAGGITQHIGAYQVTMPSGKKITFIDTPGHAAFSEMRARGANVTDIVILVVAADDGIKEQTAEAISHAKAAKVPIIVAINKVDKPDANPGRVRQELLTYELVAEDLGGDIPCVEVSAKQGLNIEKLEETILLMADILELKANPHRAAIGTVIESKVDKGRGPVATILVQRGTIHTGEIFVAGTQLGRVRALVNDKGKILQEAGPSMPVEVLGLSGAPAPGDAFVVMDNEGEARDIVEYRERRARDLKATAVRKSSLEKLFTPTADGHRKELAVIIKCDVQGSLEAITGSFGKVNSDEVSVRVIHSGVGSINESDISLAQASKALVIGFNVRANQQARDQSSKSGVEIRYYSIIYDVLDDIKALLSGMLSPTLKEVFLGYAEIRDVFSITKVGKVAGCYITSGVVKRGAKVRLLRDNIVIHEGTLKTLRRFKDEVKEVREAFECGMAFENYQDIREGDVIECFEIESIARQL